jgi:hypothetical protein
MKIGVRILTSTRGNYNHLQMKLLEGVDGGSYVNVIGSITWQSNGGEGDPWYGKTYLFENDRLRFLEIFTKVIKKVNHVESPHEVISELKAEVWHSKDGHWYRDSDAGANVYQVLRYNTLSEENEPWSSVIATDFMDAVKKVSKRYKPKDGQPNRYSVDPTPINKIPLP